MVGNPKDTKDTLAKSYEFAKRINCDSMQFYPLYLYPGTEAFAWAKENGYLKINDFSKWVTKTGLHNCVMDIPGLSASEMSCLSDDYLRGYHLRPSYLIMKLAQGLIHPSEGYRTFKAGRTFLGTLLRGRLR